MDFEPTKPLDQKSFWRLIGSRAAGATLVTAMGESGPSGFLALSATHLTASPPTMTVSIDKSTSALADVVSSGAFCVNFLDGEAGDVLARFATRGGPTGAERFDGVEWSPLTTGAPALAQSVGSLDCRLEETIERHGVVIAIGRIVDYMTHDDRKPLIYFQGKTLP